jgi:hypothetical protein
MVHDNYNRSILDGVNLNNSGEVREFMKALEYHLTRSILNISSKEVSGVSEECRAQITKIMASIRQNGARFPLLLEASIRFVSNRHCDAKGVLGAGFEFDELADENALTIPHLYPDEYEQAEARMTAIRGEIDMLRVRERLEELVCIRP